jgi:hypothetical protein
MRSFGQPRPRSSFFTRKVDFSDTQTSSPLVAEPRSPSLKGICQPARRPECVSLFDASGLSLMPWSTAGYTCHAYDLTNDNQMREGVHFWKVDLDDPKTMRQIVDFHKGAVEPSPEPASSPPLSPSPLLVVHLTLAQRTASPLSVATLANAQTKQHFDTQLHLEFASDECVNGDGALQRAGEHCNTFHLRDPAASRCIFIKALGRNTTVQPPVASSSPPIAESTDDEA